MNCFEARQDFRGFWKKELEAQRRAALIMHLSECSKCDAAFRAFALTAPVLHSHTEPYRPASIPRVREASAARRSGGAYREMHRSSAWVSMAAAAALFIVGASAAYLSVEPATPTLTEAVTQPQSEPFVSLVSSDVPEVNGQCGQ
jgi:anti-sigma factor RsiW